MKVFILDSQNEHISELKEIIYNHSLGILVGKSNNSLEGLEEILSIEPDLLILDMVNQDICSFDIIQEIKIKNLQTKFIIISSVNSDHIIKKAYKNGVEYYIPKPINEIQFLNIMRKVQYQLELEKKMKKISEISNEFGPLPEKIRKEYNCERDINSILLKLGIIGERGSEDIIEIAKFIIENKVNIHDMTIRELCSKFTDNPKSMEQKMRRTINIALSNIASLGIEDYMNETFIEYSNTLFNFEQVKWEMDYLRGKSDEKGSINMKKFILGIHIHCEKLNY